MLKVRQDQIAIFEVPTYFTSKLAGQTGLCEKKLTPSSSIAKNPLTSSEDLKISCRPIRFNHLSKSLLLMSMKSSLNLPDKVFGGKSGKTRIGYRSSSKA